MVEDLLWGRRGKAWRDGDALLGRELGPAEATGAASRSPGCGATLPGQLCHRDGVAQDWDALLVQLGARESWVGGGTLLILGPKTASCGGIPGCGIPAQRWGAPREGEASPGPAQSHATAVGRGDTDLILPQRLCRQHLVGDGGGGGANRCPSQSGWGRRGH